MRAGALAIWFVGGFVGFVLPQGLLDAQSTRVLGGITFVAIPGGEFTMGDTAGDGQPNERPVRRVTVNSFWMASTELTFEQWKAFLDDARYPAGRSSGLGDDHPVVSVTWEDAKAFCDWFSRKHGVVARLPTEAEWERAARGGAEGQLYPNGNSMSPDDANFSQRGPVRVGSYKPNSYGLYDMAGNVFEWVADWYDPAREQRRADRGGGWCMSVERVRVSARHAGPGEWDQGGTADCLGFRPIVEATR